MSKSIALATLVGLTVVAGTATAAQQTRTLTGTWKGRLSAPPFKATVKARFELRQEGDLLHTKTTTQQTFGESVLMATGKIVSEEAGANGARVFHVVFEGGNYTTLQEQVLNFAFRTQGLKGRLFMKSARHEATITLGRNGELQLDSREETQLLDKAEGDLRQILPRLNLSSEATRSTHFKPVWFPAVKAWLRAKVRARFPRKVTTFEEGHDVRETRE